MKCYYKPQALYLLVLVASLMGACAKPEHKDASGKSNTNVGRASLADANLDKETIEKEKSKIVDECFTEAEILSGVEKSLAEGTGKVFDEKAATEKMIEHDKAYYEKLYDEKAMAVKMADMNDPDSKTKYIEKVLAEKFAKELDGAEAGDKEALERAMKEKMADKTFVAKVMADLEKSQEPMSKDMGEHAALDKAYLEKVMAEKMMDKAYVEKVMAEKMTEDKAYYDKVIANKEMDKAYADKLMSDKIAEEKAFSDKRMADKTDEEKAYQDKAYADKMVKAKMGIVADLMVKGKVVDVIKAAPGKDDEVIKTIGTLFSKKDVDDENAEYEADKKTMGQMKSDECPAIDKVALEGKIKELIAKYRK